MTMHDGSSSTRSPNRTSRPTPSRVEGRVDGVRADGVRAGGVPIPLRILRLALAGLLGVAVALLISCGSSGAGLIPVGNAGPLQRDFEAVAQAAENGNGRCTATEAAIFKTENDFSALPSTVNRGLRNRLHEGIAKLRSNALGLCKQPLLRRPRRRPPQGPPSSTRTTSTTPTVTATTNTQTTPTTTPTTSGPGGGTPAPGSGGSEAAPGTGSEPGGAGAGGAGGAGAGVGGQEGGK